MAKKVLTVIKLQIQAGNANPAPPVGPALGQHGVNIMDFCKAFNAQTQGEGGTIIPVEITVYEDRSFTFVTKSPPAAILIKQTLNLAKGSAEPLSSDSACLISTAAGGLLVMNVNDRSSYTVITTGITVPRSDWVWALNALTNSMMLTPC